MGVSVDFRTKSARENTPVSECEIQEKRVTHLSVTLMKSHLKSAEGQNRTADTGIFSPLLYRLSYLGSLIKNASYI